MTKEWAKGKMMPPNIMTSVLRIKKEIEDKKQKE